MKVDRERMIHALTGVGIDARTVKSINITGYGGIIEFFELDANGQVKYIDGTLDPIIHAEPIQFEENL